MHLYAHVIMPPMNTIKNYNLPELQTLVKGLGQPAFRAKQLYEWLYKHHVSTYDEMTNLPATLREKLEQEAPYEAAVIDEIQTSSDGTRKYLIKFNDGVLVESVGIPSEDGKRLTVCVSTQAGCPMACAFCATGQQGLTRNLVAGEIIEQVLLVQKDFNERVSNVVFMGQGEPFLNYDNVMKALRILNDATVIGIGARSMTVSTCGVIEGIKKFTQEPEQFNLALSLHATDQELRDGLMPKVRKDTLQKLYNALMAYTEQTNRRVTIEYLMIKDVNDSEEDLEGLASFTKGMLAYVNLIPINTVPEAVFQPSDQETLSTWENYLRKHGTEAIIRNSRGQDIDGACGQLKNTRK